MSRVGISTACFYPQDTFASFLEVLSAGAPAVEVFMNALSEINRQYLSRFRTEAAAHGAEIVSFHPYTSAFESLLFFSEYVPRQNDGLEMYKRFFDAAAFLGARCFVFHGERSTPTFSRGLSTDGLLCEVYGRLIETAKSFGLVFTQENVNNFRSHDPAFLRRLRTLLPELRFTFDLKQAIRAKVDCGETVRAMGDRLFHIHINDFGERECCLPFDGTADLAGLRDSLKEIGYAGDYIIEVYRASFGTNEELSRALLRTEAFFCPSESESKAPAAGKR